MKNPFPTKFDAFQPANLNELSAECLRHRIDEYRRILTMFTPYTTPEARALKELLEDAIHSASKVLEQRHPHKIEEYLEV